jgi:uncharacterized protein (TIGR02391 family)
VARQILGVSVGELQAGCDTSFMISVSAQQALELPVDELALLVLSDLARTEEWNEYNYLNSYKVDRSGLGFQSNFAARKAISEAMTWLRAQGMVARGVDQPSDAAIFTTRRGHQSLGQSLAEIHAINRLQVALHPLIDRKVRRQFLLGEYENAIFVALKAVEVRVRNLGGYGNEVIGVDLMTKAFKVGGPLADGAAPPGEIDGTMMLFRGAYAILRNPSGHREVSFDDVTEASEAVMTASLLMRMLDRIEKRMGV